MSFSSCFRHLLGRKMADEAVFFIYIYSVDYVNLSHAENRRISRIIRFLFRAFCRVVYKRRLL